MGPAPPSGHHLAEPAAELNTAWSAHDRKPYSIVPQLLQDRAGVS
jgi:hypothetical protein